MKQLYHTAGHMTFDLTECKLHRTIDKDGEPRFVISYPRAWTTGDPQEIATVAGTRKLRSFEVTEWGEVELVVKP